DQAIFQDVNVVAVPAAAQNADFNGDGVVDGADFLVWQRGFGTIDPLRSDGNADGDADVDADDLAAWREQFGQTLQTADVAAVPEPSALLLLAFAVAATLTHRNCR